MYKQNKGITLSALIIVILVLLILTGIIVDFALDGTLIDKAEETVTKANEKTGTDKEIEKEIKEEWEDTPGETIQSPTREDTTIVLTATTSNITKKSFKITVKGNNKNGDKLSFNLTVGDTVYEQKENDENTVSWNVQGLENNTYYEFKVTASDGKTQNFVNGKVKTSANKIPKITTKVKNITAQTATIEATGTDADGDTLTYTLKVNGKTYGPGANNSWNITGLTKQERYLYVVTVTDGTDTVEKNGYFTATQDYLICPGNTIYCPGYYSYECTSGVECSGQQEIPCPGPVETTYDSGYILCSFCETNNWRDAYYECSTCGTTRRITWLYIL